MKLLQPAHDPIGPILDRILDGSLVRYLCTPYSAAFQMTHLGKCHGSGLAVHSRVSRRQSPMDHFEIVKRRLWPPFAYNGVNVQSSTFFHTVLTIDCFAVLLNNSTIA